jgi:hypothetical protein
MALRKGLPRDLTKEDRIVETLSHREGSQKDDVAVGARCNVPLKRRHWLFAGEGALFNARPSPRCE